MSLIREGELCGLVVFASDWHSGGVLFKTMIIDWPKIKKINVLLTSFYIGLRVLIVLSLYRS